MNKSKASITRPPITPPTIGPTALGFEDAWRLAEAAIVVTAEPGDIVEVGIEVTPGLVLPEDGWEEFASVAVVEDCEGDGRALVDGTLEGVGDCEREEGIDVDKLGVLTTAGKTTSEFHGPVPYFPRGLAEAQLESSNEGAAKLEGITLFARQLLSEVNMAVDPSEWVI